MPITTQAPMPTTPPAWPASPWPVSAWPGSSWFGSSFDAGLPMMAGWIELWMMPFAIFAPVLGLSPPIADDEPEIDRNCADRQLPVPNVHQKDMDHDLFA